MKAIQCSCHNPQHSILIDGDDFGVFLWIGYTKSSLWARMKTAFNHVFNMDNNFCDILLDEKQVDKFIEDLEEAKEMHLKERKKSFERLEENRIDV